MIDKAGSFMYNNFCVIDVDAKIKYWQCRTSDMEKYSRGRRGAPAKGVGRVTGARVQIPLSPFRLPSFRIGSTGKSASNFF